MSTPESPESDAPHGVPAAGEPAPCHPCRGTGKVVSRLGGDPAEVTCPWCEGTGAFRPGGDAQAHWRAAGPGAGE